MNVPEFFTNVSCLHFHCWLVPLGVESPGKRYNVFKAWFHAGLRHSSVTAVTPFLTLLSQSSNFPTHLPYSSIVCYSKGEGRGGD